MVVNKHEAIEKRGMFISRGVATGVSGLCVGVSWRVGSALSVSGVVSGYRLTSKLKM
jgi:hypothetical protein